MIAFAKFDSAILNTLQHAVDHAWLHLPSEQRTNEIKDKMAKAVMRSAAQGERDPNRLDAIAAAAVSAELVDAYDIEVRQGEQTISSLRSVELPHLSAIWGLIAELAKQVSSPDCRIRVTDQSGRTVISVGIATARLFRPA
jgi:hypothetical protein